MGWVRVSDDFYDHPKFADITPLSWAVWIAGLAYANRNLTDGRIPVSAAQRLCDFSGIAYSFAGVGNLASMMEDDCMPLAIHDLVMVGLWHENEHECDMCPQPGPRRYIIHDYLEYQPSAQKIGAERQAARNRMARVRANREKGSDEVRANRDRTSPEVRSTPTPTPTPSKSPAPQADADADAFDTWWTHYPKKKDKGHAKKAYRAALKKTDADTLLDAVQKFAATATGAETRFIPYPATWLNGERWTDEPELPPDEHSTWDLGEWA